MQEKRVRFRLAELSLVVLASGICIETGLAWLLWMPCSGLDEAGRFDFVDRLDARTLA